MHACVCVAVHVKTVFLVARQCTCCALHALQYTDVVLSS